MDAAGGSAVSQAGGVLLTSTVRAAGLDVALSQALAPWRQQLARHDPAKVLIDLAMTLALGGEDVDKVLAAINTACARSRARVWTAAGSNAPDHGRDVAHPLVIDIDATLVTAHSEKEKAAPTFKRGFGFHPLCAFVDHGTQGTGEPVAVLLRAENAGRRSAAGR